MGEVCESSSRTEPNIYISEIQILLIRRDKATLLLYCELTKRVSFEAILRSQKNEKLQFSSFALNFTEFTCKINLVELWILHQKYLSKN